MKTSTSKGNYCYNSNMNALVNQSGCVGGGGSPPILLFKPHFQAYAVVTPPYYKLVRDLEERLNRGHLRNEGRRSLKVASLHIAESSTPLHSGVHALAFVRTTI